MAAFCIDTFLGELVSDRTSSMFSRESEGTIPGGSGRKLLFTLAIIKISPAITIRAWLDPRNI